MREFLDNHPAIALLTACVVCIATTVAVLTFYRDQQHANAIANAEATIRNLKADLASIKRGIPVDTPRPFNVSSAVLDENRMLLLSRDFTPLIPNVVSVKAPRLDGWVFQELNELSSQALTLDDKCKTKFLQDPGNDEIARKTKPVFMWHKRESSSAYVEIPEQHPLHKTCSHMRMFPSLSVLQIDSDWVKANMKFFAFYLPKDKISKENVTKMMKDPAAMIRGEETATKYMSEDNIVLSEFTGPFLYRKLHDTLLLSTLFPEVAPRLMSIEHAKNTLYFHNRYRIQASLTKGNLRKKVDLVLDDEYFVLTVPESAIVVNVTLPVVEGHDENFGWTQRWLSGLRVQSVHR